MFVRTCPKCAYVRKDVETAPAWQCPSCGIAYAKYGETTVTHKREIPEAPSPIMLGDRPLLTNKSGKLNIAQIIGLIVLAGVVVVGAYDKLAHKAQAQRAMASAQAGQELPVTILYATAWCPYCKQTRKLLEKEGVKYVEIDVEKEPNSQEHLKKKFHVFGFPIVEVDGEIVVGYHPADIQKLVAGAQHI